MDGYEVYVYPETMVLSRVVASHCNGSAAVVLASRYLRWQVVIYARCRQTWLLFGCPLQIRQPPGNSRANGGYASLKLIDGQASSFLVYSCLPPLD